MLGPGAGIVVGLLAAVAATLGLRAVVLARRLRDCRRRGEAAMSRAAQAERSNEGLRTAQSSAENARQASEARIGAVLEAAVDGIITIDAQGRIQSFNRAAERIFQYTAAEVAGRNVNILMPEPYHSAHDRYLSNYLSSGQARIIGIGREVMGLRKDGSTFPMDLAVGESVLEGRRIFAGIVRDISERKRTEERLLESEQNFRLLVGGVRDYAITLLDAQGRITTWNQGAERLHGWTVEEALGQHFSLLFAEEDVAAGEPERVMAIVARDGSYEGEGTTRRKDGEVFWAHVNFMPLATEAGAIRGYARIARDMTEQRAYEDALRQAKDEAERANLAKSKFLAAASHDLRQPVQALVFFTTALSMRITEGAAASMLVEVQNSLEGLNMLLESLLDVSKLDAGVLQPQISSFPISDILGRLASEFGPEARAKGLSLRVMDSNAVASSDPALLGRVLRNLVANAVRYTTRGKVLVGVRRRAGHLRVEVWDTGVGIPPERQEEVFQEFTQLGNAERDRSQGLGLGLAIVRRLTRLLDSPLTLRSRPGWGSVFTVEVRRAAQSAVTQKEITIGDGDRRLVVIIDDEAIVLKGLGLILESWGYEVVAAGSEDEAVALLEARRERPHAILADYRLRDGRTGAEAVRHIRALFKAPIPSIIITGDTAPERLREAEASGFSILHKPVKPPHLHNILQQTIGGTLH